MPNLWWQFNCLNWYILASVLRVLIVPICRYCQRCQEKLGSCSRLIGQKSCQLPLLHLHLGQPTEPGWQGRRPQRALRPERTVRTSSGEWGQQQPAARIPVAASGPRPWSGWTAPGLSGKWTRLKKLKRSSKEAEASTLDTVIVITVDTYMYIPKFK